MDPSPTPAERGGIMRRIRDLVWGRGADSDRLGRRDSSVIRGASAVPGYGALAGRQWEPDPALEEWQPSPHHEVPWELRGAEDEDSRG